MLDASSRCSPGSVIERSIPVFELEDGARVDIDDNGGVDVHVAANLDDNDNDNDDDHVEVDRPTRSAGPWRQGRRAKSRTTRANRRRLLCAAANELVAR